MDFSVADAVNRFLDLAATAFGQQVMLINAGTCHHRPAAERAVRQFQGLDVAKRLGSAQIALGNHFFSKAGGLSALWPVRRLDATDDPTGARYKNDGATLVQQNGGVAVFALQNNQAAKRRHRDEKRNSDGNTVTGVKRRQHAQYLRINEH